MAPICGIACRALDILGAAGRDAVSERAGLEHATMWLAALPARHAVARGAACHDLADALGGAAGDVVEQLDALRADRGLVIVADSV